MKTRRNFLFAYGANRLYQRIGFTENIYPPEEDPRGRYKALFH